MAEDVWNSKIVLFLSHINFSEGHTIHCSRSCKASSLLYSLIRVGELQGVIRVIRCEGPKEWWLKGGSSFIFFPVTQFVNLKAPP